MRSSEREAMNPPACAEPTGPLAGILHVYVAFDPIFVDVELLGQTNRLAASNLDHFGDFHDILSPIVGR